MSQYLDAEGIAEFIGAVDLEDFKCVSKDSYSDQEVLKTIRKKKGEKTLLMCAIQTAVVGFGNKNFGEFELHGEPVDVQKTYKQFDVKDDLGQSAKLELGDLTPRRLQRVFRYNIHNFLVKNEDVAPYLWKKYSTHDLKYRTVCFPGAESMINDKEQAIYLINVYKDLDLRLGLNITEKIKRILVARKIFQIEEIEEL